MTPLKCLFLSSFHIPCVLNIFFFLNCYSFSFSIFCLFAVFCAILLSSWFEADLKNVDSSMTKWFPFQCLFPRILCVLNILVVLHMWRKLQYSGSKISWCPKIPDTLHKIVSEYDRGRLSFSPDQAPTYTN